jgi:hypothetical protein
MQWIRSSTITFALGVAVLLPAGAVAQAPADSSNAGSQPVPAPAASSGATFFKTKLLPPVENITPSPFPTSLSTSAHAIEYRSEDQMSQTDRDLVSSAQPSIREDATLAGFELDAGQWNYRQLVCQALPDDVFLLFKRDNGGDDVSLFSAAIPRNRKDPVRIIPIQRRGFSLFSPAPVNPLTIDIFNHIQAGEPATRTADWLSTALCYAGLTGGRPETALSPSGLDGGDLSLSFPPTLQVGGDGESTVRFVDVPTGVQPMEWALTFNSKGQLLKVGHFATPTYTATPVSPAASQPSAPPSSQ